MFIYMFLNNRREVIYVGKTNNFKRRIKTEHFTRHGHLNEECYRETEIVLYAEVISENESKLYELYYIEKYKPKYNVLGMSGGKITFNLPELNWRKYVPNKITNNNRLTKKELQDVIKDFIEEIGKECTFMKNFINGKDRVTWLDKLGVEEKNEYMRTVYMMDRYIKGIDEIKDNYKEKIGIYEYISI